MYQKNSGVWEGSWELREFKTGRCSNSMNKHNNLRIMLDIAPNTLIYFFSYFFMNSSNLNWLFLLDTFMEQFTFKNEQNLHEFWLLRKRNQIENSINSKDLLEHDIKVRDLSIFYKHKCWKKNCSLGNNQYNYNIRHI